MFRFNGGRRPLRVREVYSLVLITRTTNTTFATSCKRLGSFSYTSESVRRQTARIDRRKNHFEMGHCHSSQTTTPKPRGTCARSSDEPGRPWQKEVSSYLTPDPRTQGSCKSRKAQTFSTFHGSQPCVGNHSKDFRVELKHHEP